MNAIETFIVTIGVFFMIGAAPFMIDHVSNNWDKPEYPHSGFGPDCPTWDEPLDERYLPRPQQDEEVE